MRWTGVCAAVAGASLVAACSSSSSGGNNATTGNAKTYSYSVPGTVASLDTTNVSSISAAYMDGPRESNLLEYKVPASGCGGNVSTADLIPTRLTKSYAITDGGKKIHIVLNADVKSQAGNVLTSADVQYSIDRIKAIGVVAGYLLFTVGGYDKNDPITVDSPTEFDLNLSAPNALSPQVLALWFEEILDSKTMKAHATSKDPWSKSYLDSHVADFGPWALSSFTPNQSVTYVRNPNAPGGGNIKKVVITTVGDGSARTQLLQKGQVDRAESLSFAQYNSLASSGATAAKCISANRDFLGLNWKDPHFKSATVREAVSLAIDRNQLVKTVYSGYGSASKAGVSSAFDPTEGTSSFKYDPSQAKALLAQAGYPKGFSFTLTYSPGYPGPYTEALAVYLKTQLAKVGLTVNLQSVANSTDYSTELAKKNVTAFIAPEAPLLPDPGYSWAIENAVDSGQDFNNTDLPAADTLAQKIQHEDPATAAWKADVNALSTLINDQVPVVYLADLVAPIGVRTCANTVASSAYIIYPYLDKPSISC
jgi:peptide/nickel transport system substrate-binding protein